MFDPARTSDEIELSDEDCRASLIESEAIGSSFAIPACFDSIRYFEVLVETNRGGIFIGACAKERLLLFALYILHSRTKRFSDVKVSW